MDEVHKYCADLYNALFQEELSKSKKKNQSAESLAQKTAIRQTLITALKKYPDLEPSRLFQAVHIAHLHRKSKISDPELVKAVLSAENSWKKSSGHAFEEMIACVVNQALVGTGIEIYLQRDVTLMLKKGIIANTTQDIKIITANLRTSTFDLFFTLDIDGKKFIFGCVQTKTSIRDRVTRDREPSITAMNNNFWSIAIALDGDFLGMQKFRDMVNGGGSGFEGNGWHGMYAFSVESPQGRIYKLDPNLTLLVGHTVISAKFWKEKRQWMKPEWSPERASEY